MKKQILALLVVLSSFNAVMAQDGQPQRMTAEERVKITMEKMEPLKLSDDVKLKVQAAFTDFYAAQQKAMEEMRASGNMDRDAMRAKRQELSAARDERLKAVLTAEQLKKWQDEIEPSLRPQRRN